MKDEIGFENVQTLTRIIISLKAGEQSGGQIKNRIPISIRGNPVFNCE